MQRLKSMCHCPPEDNEPLTHRAYGSHSAERGMSLIHGAESTMQHEMAANINRIKVAMPADGARRRRSGGSPGRGCARRPVGTHLYLHGVGASNHVAVLCLAR
jgi:hypothetical protein